MDRSSSNAVNVLLRFGKEGAELKDEGPDLLVHIPSNPHLWP